METVLITGGTGFLGSHICRYFLKSGYKVIITVRDHSSLEKISDLKERLTIFNIEKDPLQNLFTNHQIDYIIHLATAYGRDKNYQRVFDTNINFATKLLDVAIKNGVKKFINTDTFSSKQNNLDYLPAYHNSKRQFYNWGNFIAEESDTQFITFYLQHPYGPDDNTDKFVFFILRSLIDEIDHIDLTEGLQHRDFIHAEDIAAAYHAVLASEKLASREFDVGTGSSISIRDFVTKLKDISGNSNTSLNFGAIPTRSNEIMEIDTNLDPLHKLSWQPKIELEAGLGSLVKWYKTIYNQS